MYYFSFYHLAADILGLEYHDASDLRFATNDDGTMIDNMDQLLYIGETKSPVILLTARCVWVSNK